MRRSMNGLPDGVVNTCYNAVDRHVENGRADQAAIIYDSPITDAKETITYAQLQTRVARLGGALQERGIEKGDRVIIYMSMTPEAIVAHAGLFTHWCDSFRGVWRICRK